MDQVKIGKFIAELRKEKNMTQQQLGDKLYVINNKYTTYGPGDYSLTVADNKITKDDI